MTPEEMARRFPLKPESLPQPGVPQGSVEKFTFDRSSIFPGTVRDYYVYAPAGHDRSQPACVMIVQDGYEHIRPERRWQIPTLLDNLIHRGDIPPCVGIFIDPGKIPPSVPDAAARENRSFEYDSLGDRYARFLIEEILPEVGRLYRLAEDGGSRLIMGGSSGAMCALNAAWQRPDAFQRVFSCVGSYTAMRGGHTLAPLIRLTEPKPLRVFLQGGRADLDMFPGTWWVANEAMLATLRYADYEVEHAWDDEARHDDFHGTHVFPDALRWLWRDYPRPIAVGVNSRQPVRRVLIPGEDWIPAAGDYASAGAIAVSPAGEVFFADEAGRRICRIGPDGKVRTAAEEMGGVSDLAFAPDGRLHACQPRLRRVAVFGSDGRALAAIENLDAGSLCFAADGRCYVADPAHGRLWLLSGGARSVVAQDLLAPGCVRLTRDQGQLIVCSPHGRMAHLFTRNTDGTLANSAPYFRLNLAGDEIDSGAGQADAHPKGWSCFATRLGLQLANANGLISAIIPLPSDRSAVGVAFGAPEAGELWVSCGKRIYRRRIASPDHLWF